MAASAFAQNDIVEKLRGAEYKLTEMTVDGESVALPASPVITLRFGDDSHVSGRAPVNRYFGSFHLSASGVLHWGAPGFGSTMMAGPEDLMTLESVYFRALHAVEHLTLIENKLTLVNGAGATRLIFERANAEAAARQLQGKTLVVAKLIVNGEAVTLPAEPLLTLTLQNGRVAGFAGVNNFRGSIQGALENGFLIGRLALTRRAGPPELMDLEDAYVMALEKVIHARLSMNGLALRDESGSTVIELMAGR
jgi:heat shock protein HslJ